MYYQSMDKDIVSDYKNLNIMYVNKRDIIPSGGATANTHQHGQTKYSQSGGKQNTLSNHKQSKQNSAGMSAMNMQQQISSPSNQNYNSQQAGGAQPTASYHKVSIGSGSQMNGVNSFPNGPAQGLVYKKGANMNVHPLNTSGQSQHGQQSNNMPKFPSSPKAKLNKSAYKKASNNARIGDDFANATFFKPQGAETFGSTGITQGIGNIMLGQKSNSSSYQYQKELSLHTQQRLKEYIKNQQIHTNLVQTPSRHGKFIRSQDGQGSVKSNFKQNAHNFRNQVNHITNSVGNTTSKKKRSQVHLPNGTIGNHSIVHSDANMSNTKRQRRPIDTFTMNTSVAKTMHDFSNHENYVMQSQHSTNGQIESSYQQGILPDINQPQMTIKHPIKESNNQLVNYTPLNHQHPQQDSDNYQVQQSSSSNQNNQSSSQHQRELANFSQQDDEIQHFSNDIHPNASSVIVSTTNFNKEKPHVSSSMGQSQAGVTQDGRNTQTSMHQPLGIQQPDLNVSNSIVVHEDPSHNTYEQNMSQINKSSSKNRNNINMTQQPVSQSYNGTLGNQNKISLRFEKLKISEIIQHPQNSLYMNSQQYNALTNGTGTRKTTKKNKKKSKSHVKGDFSNNNQNQTFLNSSRSSHLDIQHQTQDQKYLPVMEKNQSKNGGVVLLPVRQSNVNFDKYLRLRSSQPSDSKIVSHTEENNTPIGKTKFQFQNDTQNSPMNFDKQEAQHIQLLDHGSSVNQSQLQPSKSKNNNVAGNHIHVTNSLTAKNSITNIQNAAINLNSGGDLSPLQKKYMGQVGSKDYYNYDMFNNTAGTAMNQKIKNIKELNLNKQSSKYLPGGATVQPHRTNYSPRQQFNDLSAKSKHSASKYVDKNGGFSSKVYGNRQLSQSLILQSQINFTRNNQVLQESSKPQQINEESYLKEYMKQTSRLSNDILANSLTAKKHNINFNNLNQLLPDVTNNFKRQVTYNEQSLEQQSPNTKKYMQNRNLMSKNTSTGKLREQELKVLKYAEEIQRAKRKEEEEIRKEEEKKLKMEQNRMSIVESQLSLLDEEERQRRKRKPMIKDFELKEIIGKGNFGIVQLAEKDTFVGSGKPASSIEYALKIVRKADIIINKQIQHINSEKNVLKQLKEYKDQNKFCIHSFASFQDEEYLYLQLEYVKGIQLFSCIKMGVQSISKGYAFYAAEILCGLQFLHENNIIFRDLKPENIMIDQDGHIKFVDFGFAKQINVNKNEGKTYTNCGTQAYMAPEILMGFGYSFQADLWAWAVMVCEMISGTTPFYDKQSDKMLEKILKANPTYGYGIDSNIKDLMTNILNVDPNLRFSYNNIKSHRIFKEMNWKQAQEKLLTPPFVPDNNKIKEFNKHVIIQNPQSFEEYQALDHMTAEEMFQLNKDSRKRQNPLGDFRLKNMNDLFENF